MLLYTDLVNLIIRDITERVPELAHIQPDRVAVVASARSSGHAYGNLATCCGLRCDEQPTFSIWTRPRSCRIVAVSRWFSYRMPRVMLDGRERIYLIMLRLPRLLLHNPLPILVHELYHVGERFDRSMRPVRHGAPFDREVQRLVRRWLDSCPSELTRLAQMRLPELERRFGAVLAHALPGLARLPLVESAPAPESYARGVARLYPGHRLQPGYEVRPAPLSPASAPRTIRRRDLVLRHYHRRGAHRLPEPFARYSRRYLALTG